MPNYQFSIINVFSYPDHIDYSTVSELENFIIEVCSTCPNYDSIVSASRPVWDWASRVLKKSVLELRLEIESHEADEHFPNKYLEEKDHLLKLPLLLLETINR